MTTELLAGLILFAFVATATPGPNNMMLLASGANFGFRRTVPHMIGILLGFSLMIFLVGIGVMQIFDAFPVTYTILKVVSVGYMLWLAWKVANSGRPKSASAGAAPFTALQAAGFQWVNPKGWAMALSAISLYAPSRDLAAVAVVTFAFALVCLPAIGGWAWLGERLQSLLATPRKMTLFNRIMAVTLVLSLYPVVLDAG